MIFLFSKSQTKNCVPKSVLVKGRSQTTIASSPSQPKTERVSNERPISPGVQGPRPLVFFPPLSPKKAGTPHGQWPPRSGKLRISCLYDRHYFTLLVTAALSDQRGRSSAVPTHPLEGVRWSASKVASYGCAVGRWQRRLLRPTRLVTGVLTTVVQLSAVPPARWKVFGGRLLPSPPMFSPLKTAFLPHCSGGGGCLLWCSTLWIRKEFCHV